LFFSYYSFFQRKDELGSAQGDILLQAIQIIENHGGAIGSTRNDTI
jgi:mechanosensitive ion channel protein 1/2/3